MLSMEFIDLQVQFRRVEPQMRARMDAVLAHGRFIMGPEVAELEGRLAAFCGAAHCVSCASGTEALIMALMAWGIGPGDAVFVPPFTFFATAEAVALLGATPVMVDIDRETFNISVSDLEKAITAVQRRDAALYPIPKQAVQKQLRARAVIPVDLFGQPAEYDELLPLAKKYALLTLEDAAQAFGAEYRGRKACALGCHVAATSFFPAKPLGCYGDGGALFTEDADLADVLRSIRVHGRGDDKYDNARVGLNGRLDTLQAAILLAKLDVISDEIVARQRVAAMYAERLDAVPGLTLPRVRDGRLSVYAQYCVLIADKKRDRVSAFLKERGVPVNIYYPRPLHMLRAFHGLGYAPEDMPRALAASRAILALPFHPYMTATDMDAVAGAITEALRS
jgi:dTDP-4-amino-4,6-dideoxygalactose transaminase